MEISFQKYRKDLGIKLAIASSLPDFSRHLSRTVAPFR